MTNHQNISTIIFKNAVTTYEDFVSDIIEQYSVNVTHSRTCFHSDEIDSQIQQVNEFKLGAAVSTYHSGIHIITKFSFRLNSGNQPHMVVEYRKILDDNMNLIKGKKINCCDFAYLTDAITNLNMKLTETYKLADRTSLAITEVTKINNMEI